MGETEIHPAFDGSVDTNMMSIAWNEVLLIYTKL